MPKTDFVDSIVRWINRRLAPPGCVIEPDTELFADGLIDSMRILQLIAWTEREIGRSIPDDQILMDNFRTPRQIADTFGGA